MIEDEEPEEKERISSFLPFVAVFVSFVPLWRIVFPPCGMTGHSCILAEFGPKPEGNGHRTRRTARRPDTINRVRRGVRLCVVGKASRTSDEDSIQRQADLRALQDRS